MNHRPVKYPVWRIALCAGVLAAAAASFARPAAAMAGVSRALALCCGTVIPSVFPFLVLSRLLLESPAANFLGVLLLPYTRLLGIRSRKAPSALLCGLLGGFAAGASGVDALYESGELSRAEAQRLLVCCIGSGPAFVVTGVGTAMLGSTDTGWALLAGQLAASLLCGLLVRGGESGGESGGRGPAGAHSACAAPAQGIANALSRAVSATALLCGYIALFSFLTAVALWDGAPAALRFAAALPLEVTGACYAAAAGGLPHAALLCSAALSAMSASVFLQVRALLHPDLSIRPLLRSRLLHLPAAAAVTAGLLHLSPPAHTAAAAVWPGLVTARMPADALCATFVLCALIFGGDAPANGLRKRSNRV